MKGKKKMTKYRYATDVVFMAEEPFVYNDKECVGVSCFIEFQVINRDLKEIFFELEDNLDPYEHEDKVPLLLKRIQSFGFEWDIEKEKNTDQLSFGIDMIEYMEQVNYDHEIDTLSTHPYKFYLEVIGKASEEEEKMMNEIGLVANILEPEEISKDDFYTLIHYKKRFSVESNTAYIWVEVKE